MHQVTTQFTNSLSNWENLKRVHVIGVCGTLMAPFAAFLKRQGIAVTGSDQNVYPPMSDVLRDAGVELFSGYRAENLRNLPKHPDLVVIGNVITAQNPEAREAIDCGYRFTSLPEAMEKLMLAETCNIVVAGTHGKTTTSSLLAHVLNVVAQQSGASTPNYFIGGVPLDLPYSFNVSSLKKGGLFVLEGDEYDTAFWDKVPKFNHYLPDHAILTSVEYDHADIYPDFEAVVRAFSGLMTRVRKGGHLIACLDYPVIKELLLQTKAEVLTYGSSEKTGARFVPASIRVFQEPGNEGLTGFDLFEDGKKVAEILIQLSGMHNVLNATAVWVECRRLGIAPDRIAEAMRRFRGVKRRQEVRGEARGVLVMDDFAHHPTAVRETLRGLRFKYPGRRLVAVFEPRSATSRRKIFQNEYALAFEEADTTFVAIPYDQTKIATEEQFSSEKLVSDLKKKGRPVHLMSDVETGVEKVAQFAQKGDLVAVLSNGGFGGFIPKLLETLKRG